MCSRPSDGENDPWQESHLPVENRSEAKSFSSRECRAGHENLSDQGGQNGQFRTMGRCQAEYFENDQVSPEKTHAPTLAQKNAADGQTRALSAVQLGRGPAGAKKPSFKSSLWV